MDDVGYGSTGGSFDVDRGQRQALKMWYPFARSEVLIRQNSVVRILVCHLLHPKMGWLGVRVKRLDKRIPRFTPAYASRSTSMHQIGELGN